MVGPLECQNLSWRKSSFSAGAENCVEVATAIDGGHWVRDTKDRNGPAHYFADSEWHAFINAVKLDQHG